MAVSLCFLPIAYWDGCNPGPDGFPSSIGEELVTTKRQVLESPFSVRRREKNTYLKPPKPVYSITVSIHIYNYI
jgi:hypothetical protein